MQVGHRAPKGSLQNQAPLKQTPNIRAPVYYKVTHKKDPQFTETAKELLLRFQPCVEALRALACHACMRARALSILSHMLLGLLPVWYGIEIDDLEVSKNLGHLVWTQDHRIPHTRAPTQSPAILGISQPRGPPKLPCSATAQGWVVIWGSLRSLCVTIMSIISSVLLISISILMIISVLLLFW